MSKALGTLLIDIVKRLGYEQVTFFTSNPQNVPMYVRMDAAMIGSRPFHGHEITVMKFDFKNAPRT